jgi:hypothetical protein
VFFEASVVANCELAKLPAHFLVCSATSGSWRWIILRGGFDCFGVEIFTCPNCGGARRLLAAIKDPEAIERVLRAMNARYRARRLPFEAPELAVARAPPDGGGGWFGA